MAYATQQIRNLALLGHTGSGKTRLIKALLAHAGAAVDPNGGHTLDAQLWHCEQAGHRLHFLDTPGDPELIGRTLAVLPAVESALVLVHARSGIELATRRLMEAAQNRGLCRVVVVSHLDGGGDLPALLDQLRENFGAECLPINLPADGGTRVQDCFFARSGPPTDFGSIETAHRAIIEQVIEVDEVLLERYLAADEPVAPEQLHDAFERALREGHLIPVCFTSAVTGAGIPELMDLIVRLLPNPCEGNPPPFVKGEGDDVEPVSVIPDPQRHVLAHVFKIGIDPYAGRVALVRLHQGRLRTGQHLYVGDARKTFKLAHLHDVQGTTLSEKHTALPGDLCAISKVDELHYDAVIHDSHDEDHHHLREPPLPPPMLGLALAPERPGDEQKLAEALHKLVAEDPSLQIRQQATLNETVLYGHGELHLRIALERLTATFNVRVRTHPPSVPFRETITRAAEGHHRHKKQSGGAGQFGEVYLRIEPLARGAGFEFIDAVTGGAIPGQFIPSVEKGVRQVLDTGAIAGFPLQDVRVTVYDGKTHPVDGKDIAFQIAGRKAFLDAIGRAGAIVLEPVMNLAIEGPATSVGGITGEIAAMRGRIVQQQALPGQRMRIEAQAPLAELSGLLHRIKSQTAGAGSYTMSFSHYEQAPPRLQQELMQRYAQRRKDEPE
ncbi:translation elongation factor 2 (EF-2/EF-G) [Fontimonas thermophila]|uniref:Elongation factor G n=1 Tax=Fontimonas thermophila TaxID=1076937 RepID=A0A1I2IPM7_9GAMM|nr:elongation factor G [Fontimonas thermophila]SFF44259.1 translation elongation factor 2 (EF-2/EF-G) [Fontimonas thermophila]